LITKYTEITKTSFTVSYHSHDSLDSIPESQPLNLTTLGVPDGRGDKLHYRGHVHLTNNSTTWTWLDQQ